MHLVFRESHGLEEQAVPQDLGQRPGDVVVLSPTQVNLVWDLVNQFEPAWIGGRGAA